jgi:hypothetical protein
MNPRFHHALSGSIPGFITLPGSIAGQALFELLQGLPAAGDDLAGHVGGVDRALGQAAADQLDQALMGSAAVSSAMSAASDAV